MPNLLTHDLDQRLERLPPFPEAATRALEELGRDNVDFTRLEQVIGRDPVLTARILRIANSPLLRLAAQDRRDQRRLHPDGRPDTAQPDCRVGRNAAIPGE